MPVSVDGEKVCVKIVFPGTWLKLRTYSDKHAETLLFSPIHA